MNKGNHPNRDQSRKDLPGQENRQSFGSEELNTNKGSRDLNQVHDTRGDAQNVNEDTGRPMTGEEAEQARNKSNEGIKQGRNRS
jgi:hypothetical protein